LQTPLELSFVDVDASDALEARVRERVERLDGRFDGITSCHVYISAPHQRQRKGRLYEVRIEARVPGSELVTSGKSGDIGGHEDVYVAIRDAFDALERQLEKWKEKIRGEVKAHET
jgi:ribosomal subunit interface protein